MISRSSCVLCAAPAREHLSTCAPCGARVEANRAAPALELARRLAEPFDWNGAPDTRDTRPSHSEPVSRCACGQTMIGTRETCDGCDTAVPAPHAAPERLFEPAPAPMPGQIMGRWDPYQ